MRAEKPTALAFGSQFQTHKNDPHRIKGKIMSAIAAIAALGLAVGVVNAVALLAQNFRCKKDAAATDAALRALRSDIQSDIQTIESSLRADFQISEEKLRKELAEAKLEISQSRTTEFTQAISQALTSTLLVARSASQAEIRSGRAHR